MFQENRNKKLIEDLRDRLETLERGLNAVKLEWLDTQERLLKMAGRISKQAQRAQEKEDMLMGSPAGALTEEDLARQHTFPFLSPRAAAAQAAILARRAHPKPNGGEDK